MDNIKKIYVEFDAEKKLPVDLIGKISAMKRYKNGIIINLLLNEELKKYS